MSSTPHPAHEVDCGVVVVTYNSASHLGALLTSISEASRTASTRVVVVDNGSTDGTTDLVEASDAVLVRSAANLGYAGGINEGRRRVGPCRHVLVLNPDLRLEPEAIDRLLAAFRTDPSVGAAVPRLVDPDGRTRRSLRRDPTLLRAIGDAILGDIVRPRPGWSTEQVDADEAYQQRHAIEWATGAAIMVSADCDRAIGDWDEAYFMYSEEVDHAVRIREAGYRIDFVPDAIAVHEEGGSGTNPDLVALLALNRVRLYRSRHGRVRTALFRLVVGAHELSRGWRAERRAIAAVSSVHPLQATTTSTRLRSPPE
jgi:GT2 family glycosyltransferase